MLAFLAFFSDFLDIFGKNHLRNDDFLYYREMVNKGVILIMFLVKIGQWRQKWPKITILKSFWRVFSEILDFFVTFCVCDTFLSHPGAIQAWSESVWFWVFPARSPPKWGTLSKRCQNVSFLTLLTWFEKCHFWRKCPLESPHGGLVDFGQKVVFDHFRTPKNDQSGQKWHFWHFWHFGVRRWSPLCSNRDQNGHLLKCLKNDQNGPTWPRGVPQTHSGKNNEKMTSWPWWPPMATMVILHGTLYCTVYCTLYSTVYRDHPWPPPWPPPMATMATMGILHGSM